VDFLDLSCDQNSELNYGDVFMRTSSRRSTSTSKAKSSRTSGSFRSSSKWGKSSKRKGTGCAPGYASVCSTFQNKVQGFRTLCEQTKGTAKGNRPSPAALKTFGNWINKGANVWKVSNSQLNRWCKTTQGFKSATSAKNALCKRFGKSAIKAVCPSKTGGFIVAAAPTVKGRTFNFPK